MEQKPQTPQEIPEQELDDVSGGNDVNIMFPFEQKVCPECKTICINRNMSSTTCCPQCGLNF